MKKTSRFCFAAAALIASMLVTGCTCEKCPSCPDTSVTVVDPKTERLESLDSLYVELAKRVVAQMGGEIEDFVVTQSPGAWSVGTVLRADRSVPVSYSACRPADTDAEVASAGAPTLFPAYVMNRELSASIGLDNAVFEGVAEISANANRATNVGLSIAEAQLRMWSDIGLRKMLADQPCRSALDPGTTYRVVRGLIIGQRKFTFGAKEKGEVKAGITKIANFELKGNSDGSVSVTDGSPQGFLAIVSEFTLPAAGTAPVAVNAPETMPGQTATTVIVQQGLLEQSALAKSVEFELSAANFPVSEKIERVPFNAVMSTAEVRYFRAADEGRAQEALRALKVSYPDARLTPINLAAPEGQLEVWLPEAKRGVPLEPVCSFVSIRELGWRSGHKTNFCIANGYRKGNFNLGDYKNGGVCLDGPEPDVCRTHVQGKLEPKITCKREGIRTSCVRIP